MLNPFLILLGKLLSFLFRSFNLGNGSTWPGHITLKANKKFIPEVLSQSKLQTILIAGTNGKTTTSALIRKGLEDNGKKVLQNESGANLLNGIASTIILNTDALGRVQQDFAIFEVDENALPQILRQIKPDYLVLLNLFRDQLDRYGEVNTIAKNWKKSFENLDDKTTVILNADDPQIASLGETSPQPSPKRRGSSISDVIPADAGIQRGEAKTVLYFGLAESQFSTDKIHHAADSVHCPNCGEKLTFKAIAFSHLGDWECQHCGRKRPKIETEKFSIYPLPGLYNKYNVLAAQRVLKKIGLTDDQIEDAFTEFTPAFGRQEIVTYKDKKVQLFLSKNPTSFNQSYTTIRELGGTTLLLVLNDRIPDGKDVSWIWDVDLPDIEKFEHILISGDRVYDMALRLKYELGMRNYESKVKTYEDLEEAIEAGIADVDKNETLFVLPTYSAMLESRKILTGKKIL